MTWLDTPANKALARERRRGPGAASHPDVIAP
jgi:hypothetical protein